MRTFMASLLFFVSLSCFAQVTPTTNNDVLAYDVFDAKQGFFQTEVTFQQYAPGRILKLNIDGTGNRTYTFLDGKPFSVYDKFFTGSVDRRGTVGASMYHQLLPKDKKVEVGSKWDFSRTGTDSVCGNWKGNYLSVAREGPETTLSIDGKNTPIKTLLIEISADILQGNSSCTTQTTKICKQSSRNLPTATKLFGRDHKTPDLRHYMPSQR